MKAVERSKKDDNGVKRKIHLVANGEDWESRNEEKINK